MASRRLCVAVAVLACLAIAPVGRAQVIQRPPSPLLGPAKQVADAKAVLEKARADMLFLRKKIAIEYETKPDFKAAKETLDKAKTDNDAATKKILAKLEKDPDYKALMTKRDKAQAIIESASKPDQPSADDTQKLTDQDLANATKERTEAALEMKKMEKAAEENDSAVLAARQKFNEARDAWDTLQQQVDEALKEDPGYMPAQQAVDRAEANYKQAKEAYAQAARNAHPVTRPPITRTR